MSALNYLAQLLGDGVSIGAKEMKSSSRIDTVLSEMDAGTKRRGKFQVPEDQQLLAVRRFWDNSEISSFRDAYLLSWGLCLAHRERGPCILESPSHLEQVLAGADEWRQRPSAYRRCYQGLVKSYFGYVPTSEAGKSSAKASWPMFRDYLRERSSSIYDERGSPDWVRTAIDNQQLFERDPFTPYVDMLLNGDTSVIDRLCEQLSINKASWFLQKLVMAQVLRAVQLNDGHFLQLLRRLLDVLAKNEVLRDSGLRRLLDRYAKIPGLQLHKELRDLTVSCWGNPWLPSNNSPWVGVSSEAKSMVTDWLKLEFIEDFFTKLAEDGLGDPRRMDFWKRYVKAIDHIEFALGPTAKNSREPDFVALRKKMKGLICELETTGTNNAFIMRMGRLVAVEFSDPGNALYGYDARKSIPFDTSQILRLPVDIDNSLKQKSKAVLWQGHHGAPGSWNRWEQVVEQKLQRDFDISPGVANVTRFDGAGGAQSHGATSSNVGTRSASALPSQYSRSALEKFVAGRGIRIQDNSGVHGNLWVYADTTDQEVVQTLTNWGFTYKHDKGWWK